MIPLLSAGQQVAMNAGHSVHVAGLAKPVLGRAAGQSIHCARERLLKQRASGCQPVHAEYIEHVEQIISQAASAQSTTSSASFFS